MTRQAAAFGLALLLLPGVTHAQTPTSPPAQGSSASTGLSGLLDIGTRGTTADGDAARYERYRDLGDGLFGERLQLFAERRGWLLGVQAEHVGRRDQRYVGTATRPGRLKAWLMWDQIPILMSESTRTLFTGSSAAGVLAIDDAVQSQVQAQLSLLPTIFEQNSRLFEMRSRRDTFETGLEYLATRELTLKGQLRRTMRDGTIPYGGSFGHSSLVEMPAPVKHTTNDVEGSAEFVRDPVLLRAGYSGSWFHNDVTELVFDSPFRATDISGTSSRGRLSLPPSNSFVQVNALGSLKLPWRSRATAYVSIGALKDAGDALMAQTINSANVTAPLERTTVDGEARTSSVNLRFFSRPFRNVDVNVRFRTYDYDNRTPEFTLTQRVSFDNTPGAATMSSLGGVSTPLVHTEPFSLDRKTFEADFNYSAGAGLTAGIGYLHQAEDRNHRVIEANAEHVLRLTFDAVGTSWFTVRTKYEHGQRRGDVTDEAARELFRIGEQPGIRHFDIASRDRDRLTVIGSVMPLAVLSVNLSVAAGKDDYLQSLFGLRDNRHRVFGIGTDYLPTDRVTLGGSFTYESYKALSRSRQANPPSGSGVITYEQFLSLSALPNPGVQVADASRNWATDSHDRVKSLLLTADVARIGGKVDLGFTYDFSRARANYDYNTGPVADRTLPEEVIVETTLPEPQQLPPTRSELQRATIDGVYALTSRVGIGISVWHERYRVSDFTLDAEANPNLARGSALLLGYLYRPYTATTIWGRMIYRF